MNDDTAQLTFEQALGELQSTVEKLRGDDLSLDQALALYERGIALAGHCDALLTKAELRISISAPNGSPPSPQQPENGGNSQ